MKMRKTQIIMNKLVYLGLSILDLSKTVMYEFWYDYVKPKYGENAKLLLYGYRQLHCSCKQNIFMKILKKMLKQDLTFQILNETDHCLEEEIKKYLD